MRSYGVLRALITSQQSTACFESFSRIFIGGLATLLIGAGAQAASVMVTSPNGGEDWAAGTTQMVTWDGIDLVGNADAYLYDNGQFVAWLGSAPASQGFLEWSVCPLVGDGTTYTITVYAQESAGVYLWDSSDAPFSISGADPRPAFSLTYPSGGEVLTAGSTELITWTSSNPQGMVNVELHRDGQWYQSLGQVPMSDESYTWEICTGLADSENWTIQLSWWECGINVSSASGTFSTTGGTGEAQPQIIVTSPGNGDVLQAGTQATITWQSVNPQGGVNISLYKGGSWYGYLGYADMSANSFTWDICEGLDNGSDYHVSIDGSDSCGTSIMDVSDGQFTITGATPAPPPTFSITSPLGGETWAEGTIQSITWTSTNPTGTAYLMLYHDGVYQTYLGSAPLAGGSMDWYVCTPGGPGGGYSIRMYAYDACGRYVPDVPSGTFTITAGSVGGIEVTAPNGGETWQAGSTQNITWTTPNTTGHVNVWLLKDGVQHQYLGSAPAAAGSFAYQVCQYLDGGAEYRIRVEHSSSCGLSVDSSDAGFSIAGPLVAVTVLSPNGGETLTAGTSVPITWSISNASPDTYVGIQLMKGSEPLHFLAYVPAAGGVYNWNICPAIGNGTDYAIEIYAYGCATVSDRSDADFTIAGSAPQGTLTLTSLNGGEILGPGQTVPVTWEAENLDGYVEIKLVRASGSPVTLGLLPAAVETYWWDVCDFVGDATDYRIELSTYNACGVSITDVSDGEFEISGSQPRPVFTVTGPPGGTDFALGSMLTVTWNAVDPGGYVDVFLETDGWSYWLGNVPMIDGEITTYVESWVEPGTDYVARVSWCECGWCVDEVSPATFAILPPSRADFDLNGYVDLDDFAVFTSCATGPAVPYVAPASLPPGCSLGPDLNGLIQADLDADGDVDHSDFGLFQSCFSGSGLAISGCPQN